MKKFLVMNIKGNSAMKRVLALLLVTALTLTLSVDAFAAMAAPRINKTAVGLYVGGTYQLKLTGTKIKSVKTSNKNIATVTKKGKVTAKKAGTATITLNGTNKKSYKCKVTVKNSTINKNAISLYVGKTYQLKLTGTTISGIKTTNSRVAIVNKKGLVTAKGAGTATITLVGKNKVNHTCKVTVKKTTINKSAISLYVGGTYQLKLTGTTISGIKTTNSRVAIVNKKGLVTAKGAGTATITLVGANKVDHTCKVTVKKTTINKDVLALTEGDTYQLDLTGTKISDVNTSNPSVATVDENGLVTAEQAGTAIITLTGANEINHTCTVTVTARVNKVTDVTLSTTEPEIGQDITVTSVPADADNIKGYQWYRVLNNEKIEIEGATAAAYTVTKDDAGYSLVCVVTDQDNKEFFSEKTSIVQIVQTGVNLSTTEPEIGQDITVTSVPANADNIESYQWYRVSDNEKILIEGASDDVYTVTEDDAGYSLVCVVTDLDGNEFCSEETSIVPPSSIIIEG